MRPCYSMLLLLLCTLTVGAETPAGPLAVTVKSIDGKDIDLAKTYAGKVCLIVNVASKCSLTTQYEQLTALDKKYRDRGLAILAFPCNDFDAEEPGTNEEIKTSCKTTYGVEFDLFAKISVKGDQQSPLYARLTSPEKNGAFGGEIEWNFAKFLIDRKGTVIARFKPEVKPDAPEVVAAIERALAAEAEEETEWSDGEIGTLSGEAVL